MTRMVVRAAWLVGVLALIALTTTPPILRAVGLDTYTVRGGSMAPTIPVGSIVVVQHVAGGNVNAGDVITFKTPNDIVVTHRVLGRSAGTDPTFITQGDANSTPDSNYVPSASVIGRVAFNLPYLGAFLVLLSSTVGIVVVASLLVSLMVAGWFLDELRVILAGTSNGRAATKLAG